MLAALRRRLERLEAKTRHQQPSPLPVPEIIIEFVSPLRDENDRLLPPGPGEKFYLRNGELVPAELESN
jgi:hypothetical protein